MDYYGRRNDVLFAWHNVPLLALPVHLLATTAKGLRWGIIVRRPLIMVWGLLCGYIACGKYFSQRRPVSRNTYRLFRRLKNAVATPIEVVAKQLPDSRKQMRVLISGGLASGGIQTHTMTLYKLLKENLFDVTIAGSFCDWPPETVAEAEALGVKILFPRGFCSSIPMAAKLSRYVVPYFWANRLAPRYDRLFCMGFGRVHGLLARHTSRTCFNIYYEIMAAPNPGAGIFVSRMDGLMGISQYSTEEVARRWPDKPVCRLPMMTRNSPVPIPPVRPNVGDSPVRIAYLGRLVRYKRPDLIIRHWRLLMSQSGVGPLRYAIHGECGERELLKEIEQTMSSAGLAEEVSVCGTYLVQDLDLILANTDIVICPSLYEGLGLVLIEAMQRGVPFVAAAAGGSAELGVENPDVSIVDTQDEIAFVSALQKMVLRVRRNEINRNRLHAWAETHYGYDTLSKRWLALFEDPRTFFASNSVNTSLYKHECYTRGEKSGLEVRR